jgi:uncharacterized membrane protein
MAPMPLGVTGYELSLFVHITAVMVGFGATFAEAIAFPVAMRLNARHLPYVHRLQLAINQWLTTPAMLVVLATGFYQVADADFELGDFWLSGAFMIVIVIGGLLGAYFIPTDRKLGAMIEREIAAAGEGSFEPSAEYLAKARVEGLVGTATGLLLVAAVYLMVTKPGL